MGVSAMHCFYYQTPHGPVTIAATEKGICGVYFGKQQLNAKPSPTMLTNRAATQIQEYFAGKRFVFDLPLDLKGSEFQKAVWERVMRIPYGYTNTTAEIARAIGHDNAHRSVGAAVAKNEAAILIPTHRVVSAAGTALGSGNQAKINQGLLAMEKRYMP